jgi:hypothetical protein
LISWYYDDINLVTDELGRQVREPLVLSLGRDVLDGDVVAIRVAELS